MAKAVPLPTPVKAVCIELVINAVGGGTGGCIMLACQQLDHQDQPKPFYNLAVSRKDAEMLLEAIPAVLQAYDAHVNKSN